MSDNVYPKPLTGTVTPVDPAKTFPSNLAPSIDTTLLDGRVTTLETAKIANDTKDTTQDTSITDINNKQKLEVFGGW